MPVQSDLAAVRQMTAEFADYLRSEVVFWPLGGSRDFPKLSLGSYWLARTRLSVTPAPELAAWNAQVDAVLAQWPAAAERKAQAEFPTRARLWTTYLAEGHGRYATEAAQRAMAALLLARFPALADSPEARHLAEAEAALRAQPAGPFVWEAELAPAFPAAEFWFLYRAR
ncbi:MAG: hypothetical protein KA764_20000 [Anaerolineales bacterium]|nr:hypothetical protein [Anaerolineales bacterium]